GRAPSRRLHGAVTCTAGRLREARTRPAEWIAKMATAKNRRARRPRPLRDVRTRIFASYLLLLLVATGASVVVVREALIVRLDNRIEDQLGQEVREFRSLADGVDPNTGEPFGTNVRRIFAVFLERN